MYQQKTSRRQPTSSAVRERARATVQVTVTASTTRGLFDTTRHGTPPADHRGPGRRPRVDLLVVSHTDGSVARLSTTTDRAQPLIVRFHPDGSVTAGTLNADGVTSELQIDDNGIVTTERAGNTIKIVRYPLP